MGAAAILVLCAAGYLYLHREPKLPVKGRIVLAEFENRTGDAVFDLTLRQGLAVQLQQSPFFSLVSDESIRQALRMMKRPLDTRLTPEVARENRHQSVMLQGGWAKGANHFAGLPDRPLNESADFVDYRLDLRPLKLGISLE